MRVEGLSRAIKRPRGSQRPARGLVEVPCDSLASSCPVARHQSVLRGAGDPIQARPRGCGAIPGVAASWGAFHRGYRLLRRPWDLVAREAEPEGVVVVWGLLAICVGHEAGRNKLLPLQASRAYPRQRGGGVTSGPILSGHYAPSLNNGSRVFVFGSNLAGRHGKGAAREALRHWGASYGVCIGACGQSYAIPTKDKHLRVLSLGEITLYVADFLTYVRGHPNLTFLVTRVGCGLAGYRDEQIAPLFKGSTDNCVMPEEWRGYLY